jgi:hypothetical protein
MPVDVIWICTSVGDKELCRSHEFEVLPRPESHNPHTRIDLRDIYTATKYPIYLQLWVVLKNILREIARIASILLEVVCPADYSTLVYGVYKSYDQ